MSPFDTFKNACQTELHTVLPERVAAIDWTPQQLKCAREDSLQKLLSHAVNHSKWHQQRLKGLDLSAVTPDKMNTLPTMNKSDVQANFDAISTVGLPSYPISGVSIPTIRIVNFKSSPVTWTVSPSNTLTTAN